MKCPKCNSDNTIEIVYGKPPRIELEAADRGEVLLGGCVVTRDDPKRYCKDCKNKWIPSSIITCPKCKSIEVIPIVYGDPNWESIELARSGKIILAGSVAPKNPHHYHCKKCNGEWK